MSWKKVLNWTSRKYINMDEGLTDKDGICLQNFLLSYPLVSLRTPRKSSYRSFEFLSREAKTGIFLFSMFFNFPTHNWFNNHLKHLGRTRLGVLIRPVWLWHHFHLVYWFTNRTHNLSIVSCLRYRLDHSFC